jgi:hypothetical protein
MRFIYCLNPKEKPASGLDYLARIYSLLLGIFFWREGFEAAFGPDRMGEKGGCDVISVIWTIRNF